MTYNIVAVKFVTLVTFELSSFRENGFLDFDIGFVNEPSVIRIRNEEDLSNVWSALRNIEIK